MTRHIMTVSSSTVLVFALVASSWADCSCSGSCRSGACGIQGHVVGPCLTCNDIWADYCVTKQDCLPTLHSCNARFGLFRGLFSRSNCCANGCSSGCCDGNCDSAASAHDSARVSPAVTQPVSPTAVQSVIQPTFPQPAVDKQIPEPQPTDHAKTPSLPVIETPRPSQAKVIAETDPTPPSPTIHVGTESPPKSQAESTVQESPKTKKPDPEKSYNWLQRALGVE